MDFKLRKVRAVVTYMLCFTTILPPSMAADQNYFWSRASEPTKVEQLAKKLDSLEKHIDRTGSIVIKAPDVWGESRLMSHRGDVETQLKAKLGSFEVTTNAIQSTRDAAFLAGALSVQQQMAAVPAATGTTTTGTTTTATTQPTTFTPINATSLIDNPALTGTTGVLPRSGFNSIAATQGTVPATAARIQLEPVVELDQLNRYLKHLNELRRLNEGDDITDSPGYALNLIRIPVSVLPGRQTERGYGAEVQITVDPYISDEILPLAFRDFVTNGVVNRISAEVMDIASTIDIAELKKAIKENYAQQTKTVIELVPTSGSNAPISQVSATASQNMMVAYGADKFFNKLKGIRMQSVYGDSSSTKSPDKEEVIRAAEEAERAKAAAKEAELEKRMAERAVEDQLKAIQEIDDPEEKADAEKAAERLKLLADSKRLLAIEKQKSASLAKKLAAKEKSGEGTEASSDIGSLSGVRYPDTHHRSVAIPQSAYEAVNGATLYVVSLFAYDRLCEKAVKAAQTRHVPPENRFQNGLTMTAVNSLLERELKAAHQFLAQPSAANLWSQFCTPDLARQIRELRRELPSEQSAALTDEYLNGKVRDQDPEMCPTLPLHTRIDVDPRCGIHTTRAIFFDEIRRLFPQAKGSVTASLAWHIIVESALLNDKLNEDIREIQVLKNCQCLSTEWTDFTGPNPSMMARNQFREYVKCRWPVHVFALDPVTQDQNVSDSFSRRREMQMAAAVAASNRLVGGQALTRFARRLEYDLETLELNRTAISFSHGNDTFGWRFYPRVQAPPTPSTLSTFAHDLVLGGPSRDDDLLKRKLEPGIRECTALVVMPSFVPQVMVDVRSDWFRLASHKPILKFMHRKGGFQDTVKLSREVVSLKQLARQCSADAHLYRNGEVYRLCKAVERLDHRLPMQTHMVQVPWENTLGGFELFQSGESALKPDLTGWYGAPGIIVNDEASQRNIVAVLLEAQRDLRTAELELALLPAAADQTTDAGKAALAKVASATTRLDTIQRIYSTVTSDFNDTTVFLTGKNFSVLNARVIAGGVDVTDTIRVINRSLLSVRIPSTVSTVSIVGQTEQSVAVYLATPHGATNRLLIPVASPLQATATSAATDAANAAAAAAAAQLTKAANRYPVQLSWGDSGKDLKYAAHVNHGLKPLHVIAFDPTSTGRDPAGDLIPVVEVSGKTPWPFPVSSVAKAYASGEIALWVESKNLGGKVAIGPWPLATGNINGMSATPKQLLELILPHINNKLTFGEDDNQTVELTVTSFVRFNANGSGTGQPVIKLENQVVFDVKYSNL